MTPMDTTTEAAAESLRRRAENLFEAQLAALDPLQEILTVRLDLLKQLAETDAAYGAAYTAAEKAGWSAEQLAELGAEAPKVRPPRPRGRPRKMSSGSPAAPSRSAGVPATRNTEASTDAEAAAKA
jgi:hypothetical protein